MASCLMDKSWCYSTANLITQEGFNQLIEISSEAYQNPFGIDLTSYKIWIRKSAELVNVGYHAH